MNRVVSFLLLVFCCSFLPASALQVNYVDTTHCTVKTFDEKRLSTYKAQHEFDYETTPPKEGGLSALISYLIAEFFDNLGKVHVGSVSLYDLLFYGLAFFAAIMLVLQFFKINVTGIFLKSPDTFVKHQAFTENVHELDFDTLIANALKNADYRMATRLYYLKTLKKLSDSGLINWQKNKTNFEYYYELKGTEQRKQFYVLTRIFESAWYGNLEITPAEFDENLKTFTGFLQNMNR